MLQYYIDRIAQLQQLHANMLQEIADLESQPVPDLEAIAISQIRTQSLLENIERLTQLKEEAENGSSGT
jgi:hypothetical protein